jgi:hypothetical protein
VPRLWSKWILRLKPRPSFSNGTYTPRPQQLNNVPSTDKHNGVLILAHLLVHLIAEERRRDEDAELTKPKAGNQPAHRSDTNCVRDPIALRFKRELDAQPICAWPEEVRSDSISATVAPWACQIDCAGRRGHDTPQLHGNCSNRVASFNVSLKCWCISAMIARPLSDCGSCSARDRVSMRSLMSGAYRRLSTHRFQLTGQFSPCGLPDRISWIHRRRMSASSRTVNVAR